MNLFDVNYTWFSILGYPLSPLEIFGTIFNLWSVILAAKNKVLNYPIGIIGVILFFILFYQVRLYSDVFLQVYFFIMSVFGWYVWTHPKTKKEEKAPHDLKISNLTPSEIGVWLGVLYLGTVILGVFMSNIHTILPTLFPEPASYPYWDALTSVGSLVAMYLMAKRKFESWYLWIACDAVDLCIYFMKDVKLVSIEYLVFLIIAIFGLYSWRKEFKGYAK